MAGIARNVLRKDFRASKKDVLAVPISIWEVDALTVHKRCASQFPLLKRGVFFLFLFIQFK